MYLFLAIIILALGIRVFYFVETNGQTSWWDSAEYLSQGLHYLNGWNGITDNYEVNFQRPPAFQYLIAMIFMMGGNETTVILLLCLLPSVLLIFLVYILGKEMFNERIALVGSFLSTVGWSWLFWTSRVQPDFLSMCFQILSIYFFFRTINKKGNINWNMFLSGILSAAAFNIKIQGLLIPMIMLFYLLITQRLSIFKKKENWMFILGFIILIIPYLIWAQISFGNPFILRSGYKSSFENHQEFAWGAVLSWFYKFFMNNIFFLLFMSGLIWISWNILSKLDLELKSPSKNFPTELFILLTFIITSLFYIIYIGGGDERWQWIWLPFLYLIVAKVTILLFDLIYMKTHKTIALIIVVSLLVFLAFGQIQLADKQINISKNSYAPVKEAALWMKANSQPSESILTLSYTQNFFYSQRPTYVYSNISEKDFNNFYKSIKPKFLVVSIFEPQSQWIFQYVQNNSAVTPVMVYFNDPQTKTQPVLIIYQFNYNT